MKAQTVVGRGKTWPMAGKLLKTGTATAKEKNYRVQLFSRLFVSYAALNEFEYLISSYLSRYS